MSIKSPKCSQESVKAVHGLGVRNLQWEGLVKKVGFESGVKRERLMNGRSDDDDHEVARLT